VAYDRDLAEDIRDLLVAEPDVTERKMFGGVAFLLAGNMAVCASGQGGLMVRVRPDETDHVLARTKAEPMVMKGRPVRGWVRVGSEHLQTRRQLSSWVDRGTGYARTLPPRG
jgi:hypothetical protein